MVTADDSAFFYWSFYSDSAKATFVIIPKHNFLNVAINKTSSKSVEIYANNAIIRDRFATISLQTGVSASYIQMNIGNTKKMTIYIRTRDVITSVGKYTDETQSWSLDYFNFKISY